MTYRAVPRDDAHDLGRHPSRESRVEFHDGVPDPRPISSRPSEAPW